MLGSILARLNSDLIIDLGPVAYGPGPLTPQDHFSLFIEPFKKHILAGLMVIFFLMVGIMFLVKRRREK